MNSEACLTTSFDVTACTELIETPEVCAFDSTSSFVSTGRSWLVKGLLLYATIAQRGREEPNSSQVRDLTRQHLTPQDIKVREHHPGQVDSDGPVLGFQGQGHVNTDSTDCGLSQGSSNWSLEQADSLRHDQIASLTLMCHPLPKIDVSHKMSFRKGDDGNGGPPSHRE